MTLSNVISLFPHKKGTVPVCDTKGVAVLHNRHLLHVASTNENIYIYIYIYIYGTAYVQIHYTEHPFYHVPEQLSQDVPAGASFLSDKAVMLWDTIKRTPCVCM